MLINDTVINGAFLVVAAIVVIGIVLTVVLVAVVVRKTRPNGINPLTLFAPGRSMADRLAELDALRTSGTISDDEHRAARAAVLGGK